MADVYSIEGGAVPAGASVVRFQGIEGLSRLYRFEVLVSLSWAAAEAIELPALLGTAATLTTQAPDGGATRTVRGIIAAAEWVEGALLRLDLVPRLWLATLDRHNRVWVDRSFPDILEEVLRDAGLAGDDYALRLSRQYRPIEHVCQYRESHYDFVQRWMEKLGIYYFFDHAGEREKLVVTDTKATHRRDPSEPVRYYPTGDADASGTVALWSFSHRRAATSAEARVRDYHYGQPALDVSGAAPSPLDGEGALVWSHHDGVTTPADATRVARLRAELLQSDGEAYVGAGRVFDLCPGNLFALVDHPRAAFDREYLVTEVVHRGSVPAGASGARGRGPRVDDIYHVTVTGIRSDVQYRPPMLTPLPRVEGVEVGHVDGPADSDYAQLDDQGRYLVRLHFDENDNPDGAASTRVRMMQPHNGAPEGWHFPLRKGTEVMVVFVGGDPDRPLIAAAVPNADTPSPVTDANGTQNVIHTGGDNRFELEDTAGSQYIDIFSPPKRSFIHLGAHHGSHAHNAIASTDGNGLIHQGSDQDIMVDSDKTEDVEKAVKEKYDDTQTTDVDQKVTETYHATQTTKVDSHVQEQYKTHTTEVTGHKIERCASQHTEVNTFLDEHHGTQDTTVDGSYATTCATHRMTVTNTSAQFYDSVTFTIGAGGFTVNDDSYFFVDAKNYQVLVPQVTEVDNVNTEAAPSDWKTIKAEKTSRDLVKISMIAGAVSLIGVKRDLIGLNVGYTPKKISFLGGKSDVAGVKIEKVPLIDKKQGAEGIKFAIKVWL